MTYVRQVPAEGWNWSDPDWRERVGNDVIASYQDALLRAVDIRDAVVDDGPFIGARAVMLVDSLNHLGSLLSRALDVPTVLPPQPPDRSGRRIIKEALRWPSPDADVAETTERLLHAVDFDPEAFRDARIEVNRELAGIPDHPLLLALKELVERAAASGLGDVSDDDH